MPSQNSAFDSRVGCQHPGKTQLKHHVWHLDLQFEPPDLRSISCRRARNAAVYHERVRLYITYTSHLKQSSNQNTGVRLFFSTHESIPSYTRKDSWHLDTHTLWFQLEFSATRAFHIRISLGSSTKGGCGGRIRGHSHSWPTRLSQKEPISRPHIFRHCSLAR